MSFERDLWLWEEGKLSEPDLRARHPGRDTGAVLALHRVFALAGADPVPEDETAWERLRAQLPERAAVPPQRLARRWVGRPLLVAAAVVALSGAAAFAASPTVRGEVAKAVHAVTHLFGQDRTMVGPPAGGAGAPVKASAAPSESSGPSGVPSTGGGGSSGSTGGGGQTSGGGQGGGGTGSSDGGSTSTDQGGGSGSASDGTSDQQGSGTSSGDSQGSDGPSPSDAPSGSGTDGSGGQSNSASAGQ